MYNLSEDEFSEAEIRVKRYEIQRFLEKYIDDIGDKKLSLIKD
jgi:hypothetical protein